MKRHKGLFPLIVVLLLAWLPQTVASPLTDNSLEPGFPTTWMVGKPVHFGSPTMGDLDSDGDLEIVVGGQDGWLYAVAHNGSQIWSRQTADALNGVAPNPSGATIRSAPALGDLDNDGDLEVVVSVGDILEKHENGGVVVYDKEGNLLAGWPRLTLDRGGNGDNPDGYTDGIAASPALGDLDNDGDLEVVVGAFDKGIYVWHHNGTLAAGWPIYLIDTIWSSPALADIDRDGYLEIIIGTDAHPEYRGGSLHVYNHDGTTVAGFPRYVDQIIQSSPAVADLDDDGWLDIVVGTGTYYGGTGGYKVHAWDKNGNYLPGWPVATGGNVPASPAIGDIDADGDLEVVVGCMDKYMYAWHHNGSLAWKVQPMDSGGNTKGVNSPILADYDDDGTMEVLLSHFWQVIVLAGINGSKEPPIYSTAWTVEGTPAVGDVDDDNKLELVIGGARDSGSHAALYMWETSGTISGNVDLPWPMFHRDAQNTGLFQLPPTLSVEPESLYFLYQYGSGVNPIRLLTVKNLGSDTIDWSVVDSPSDVTVEPSSGSVTLLSPDQATVTVAATGYAPGTYQLGDILIAGAGDPQGSPQTIPIILFVGDLKRVNFPLVSKNH